MQIVFVSNYINHHQLPFCNELYSRYKDEFAFIQTEPMSEERINMGWDDSLKNLPFVKLFYEQEDMCRKMIFDAKTVIFGGASDEEIIIERLLARKFTIRYSERIYKEGRYKFISPRGLLKKYHDHIRFRNYPDYMLCAGAYTAGDFSMIGAYPGKLLNFGYFPEVITYEDVHALRTGEETVRLLWVSRFIDWKYPDMPVDLMKKLVFEDNLSVELTMVGNGPLLESVQKKIEALNLSKKINLLEGLSPKEVRKLMLRADVFLLTSDKGEGWGAVVNEAMNSGCAVIAGHETGAAPMLIKQGENGFMFESRNLPDLYNKAVTLIKDGKLRRQIGTKAYETMVNTWNVKVAVERLIEFIDDEEHKVKVYDDLGPLSKAENLSFKKVLKKINTIH